MPRHLASGISKLLLLCALTFASSVALQAGPEFCDTCDCCVDSNCPYFHWYDCGTLSDRCANHGSHYCDNIIP